MSNILNSPGGTSVFDKVIVWDEREGQRSSISLLFCNRLTQALSLSLHIYVHICLFKLCVCVCAYKHRHPQRVGISGPLELELQTVVSCIMWLLGTELWTFGRAERAANH